MFTKEELQPCAMAGATLLDVKMPQWSDPDRIYLWYLDMGRADYDVLGHLFEPGGYHTGTESGLVYLRLDEGDLAERYGFDLPDMDEETDDRIDAWELLTDLWYEEIQRRRDKTIRTRKFGDVSVVELGSRAIRKLPAAYATRYTDNERTLYEAGLCCTTVACGGAHGIVACGQASTKRCRFGNCTDHHLDAVENYGKCC